MKRLHSFVDWEGETGAQAVTPCFDFSHPSGEEEEIAHCNSDMDGWKHFCPSFWASFPSSAPEFCLYVQVGAGQNKKKLLIQVLFLFSFPKQGLVGFLQYFET